MSSQGEYYRPSEVVGPALSLASQWFLLVPLAGAVVCGVLAGLSSPNVSHGEALESLNSLFGTTAQVIAALFVALAVGARYVKEIRAMTAALALLFMAVGLVAAVMGTSTGLPHKLYPVLLGVTVGGGLGGLATVLVVGFAALRYATIETRLGRIENIVNPTELAEPPADRPTDEQHKGT